MVLECGPETRVTLTLESGTNQKLMAMEFMSGPMEIVMRGSGGTVSNMTEELTSSRMGTPMWENTITGSQTVSGLTPGRAKLHRISVSSRMDRNTVKESGGRVPLNLPTSLKAHTRTTRRMAKASIPGHLGTDMRETTEMMREKEKGSWYGQMDRAMRDSGEVGSSMVKGKWFSQMGELKKGTLKIMCSKELKLLRFLRRSQGMF